jgi:PAS domain S-box-containing protein
MGHLRTDINKQFTQTLEEYLDKRNEDTLVAAYELGRRAVDEGLGELDLLNLFQKALENLNSNKGDGVQSNQIKHSLDFLAECLAPFEMRQRGFRDLITRLNAQNEQLQDEIERRKEFELELKRSKEHFQHLIENALDIITVLNYDGTIRYESPSLERILGYTPEELIGRSAFDFIHPDDVDEVQRKLFSVINEPGYTDSAEYRFKHNDGSWRYLESIAKNVIDAREGPGVIVNSRDVTERVLAHEKLTQSQNQLATAQQIAMLGSWEWDIRTNSLNWSEVMCNIYGVPTDDYPNSYDEYLQYIHPDDRDLADEVIQKAFDEKSSFEFEHRIQRSDGSVRTLYCRGEVETDSNGEPVKMIGIGHDITKIKEAEYKLRAYSEQLKNLSVKQDKIREEERTRIARELHDELGQMLTVLKMDISLAYQKTKAKYGEEFISTFTEEIDSIDDRIDTIIRSVQRITAELRPELLDDLGLAEAIELQVQEFSSRTNLAFSYTNDAGSLKHLDDERATAIFRIFQEALTNVLRHSRATKVDVYLYEENSYLFLIVQDNGKGISREDIDHPDSLGLTGMKERCQFIGGEISFSGKKGKGTKVMLKIPLEGTLDKDS